MSKLHMNDLMSKTVSFVCETLSRAWNEPHFIINIIRLLGALISKDIAQFVSFSNPIWKHSTGEHIVYPIINLDGIFMIDRLEQSYK